jgi:hypothetical protein
MKIYRKGKIRLWMVFALVVMVGFGLLVVRMGRGPVPETTQKTEGVVEGSNKPGKGFAKPVYTKEEMEEMDAEAYSGALLTGEGCETIRFDEALRQTCFDTKAYDLALKNSDSRECEKIKDVTLRSKCLDQVSFAIALKSQDLKLCEKIKEATLRQECTNRLLATSGRTAASAEQCEAITDPVLRQTCLDNYHLASGMRSSKVEDCAVIADADLKSRCVQTVERKQEVVQLAKIQTKRTFVSAQKAVQDCDSIQGDEAQRCKDEANRRMAFEKMDAKYCQLIKDAALSSGCTTQVNTARSSFYLQAAVNEKNPALCEQIPDLAIRSECKTYAQ